VVAACLLGVTIVNLVLRFTYFRKVLPEFREERDRLQSGSDATEMVPGLEVLETGWKDAITILNSQGWKARYWGGAAPVQVEGHLPTGENFYFRARSDSASLGVGGEDPADTPSWYSEQSVVGASYLAGAPGLDVILNLWEKYKSDR
jgi:hypothetical protein